MRQVRKRVESPLFQKHQLTHIVYVNKKTAPVSHTGAVV